MRSNKKNLDYDICSEDTIKIDKEEIIKGMNKKRSTYNFNQRFPIMTLIMIFIYIGVYFISVYGKENLLDVNINSLNLFKVYRGNDILNGEVLGILTNPFIHRSIWDLVNTIFILLFCGFFVERYVKRGVILSVYILSIIGFNLISIFVYGNIYYLGSFTIVSSLIGMCIYFCYRFKKIVMGIDIYIYIALTFIGIFISYMVGFYNVFHFLLSYFIGIIVMFILDKKVLRIKV